MFNCKSTRHLLDALVATAACCLGLSAQAAQWTLTSSAGPPWGRDDTALAYDSLRQRVVLFGGVGYTDTWEWDGTIWEQKASPTFSVGQYGGHAMAYHELLQVTVMFGNSAVSPSLVALWNGTTWIQGPYSGNPSTRTQCALAYDAARQSVLLFGGLGSGSALGDTWEWNGGWLQRSPATTPPARYGHAMAYDRSRQRVVMFGGSNNIAYLADTWEWDGSNWLAGFSPYYPSPRQGHAMTYDSARQRVVMYGGSSQSDTWDWNGVTWTQQPTSAAGPGARQGVGMAYDELRQRVVIFGGQGQNPDLWYNGGPTVPALAIPFGSGCGSPALGLTPGTSPRLGQTASATITSAPTLLAGVALGFSRTTFGPFSLPVSLGSIGMPGCDLWQSADLLGLGTSPLTPSTLSFSLAIPNVTSVLGLHVFLQAYAFAPGVNPLQIVISNAIDWMLGDV